MSADRATEAAGLLWQIGQENLVRAVFSLCRDPPCGASAYTA